MSRLLIHVEGETEETFVNEVLLPLIFTDMDTRRSAHGLSAMHASVIGEAVFEPGTRYARIF
ncbi:MAG: hypothetical protein V9G16_00605 [Nitrosomonas sp.]